MHRWDVSVEEAIAIQKDLRQKVIKENQLEFSQIKTVAGIDASYKDDLGKAAIVIYSFPDLQLVDRATAALPISFPYVPGLLSFREAPAVLEAYAKLQTKPDVLIFDGQGIAHPRRLGIAAHLGIYLDMPGIGCAKSRLIGTYTEPGNNQGDFSYLRDGEEILGVVLRSKPKTNPLFVSPGHKIDLDTALKVILQCLKGYRLPEPTRMADIIAETIGKPELDNQPRLF
jgi:deoxyribonuclease V